jgi:hypothetical protein
MPVPWQDSSGWSVPQSVAVLQWTFRRASWRVGMLLLSLFSSMFCGGWVVRECRRPPQGRAAVVEKIGDWGGAGSKNAPASKAPKGRQLIARRRKPLVTFNETITKPLRGDRKISPRWDFAIWNDHRTRG